MFYRRFGKTGIQLPVLGFGTNRFKADTGMDIEAAAELIRRAVDSGINYIDVAETYSKGAALEIVRKALEKTEQKPHLTVKVSYLKTKTADGAFSKTKSLLQTLGLPRASFFVVWSITSFSEYKEIIKKGSLLDGAIRAKQEGLVDHICFSTHAPPDDIIKIMEDGIFEGVTISYSVLNQNVMQDVLKRAGELDIGVITMNSLAGGLIPQNSEFFSFIKQDGDTDVCGGALRYSSAHPEICCMLSGMTCQKELDCNMAALSGEESPERREKRITAVDRGFSELNGFCTGCRYCAGCPEGIDCAAMMQAYNAIYFTGGGEAYGRSGKRLLENINICKKLKQDFTFIPPDTENPCIKCGECEKKCTQSIPISARLEELYKRFDESGFSRRHYAERLRKIIMPHYKKIAFYPAGGYTTLTLEYLREALPDLQSELFLFDSSKNLWGTLNNGIAVRPPSEIPQINPDLIVISNYIYADEIYESIKHFEELGIAIVKLHEAADVPWVF
jgi:predicted aldo/keto reductase-like oxidoreductase